MTAYTYQCTFCKTNQVVHIPKRKKAKKTIQGFCAKDKFHSRTKFILIEEESE